MQSELHYLILVRYSMLFLKSAQRFAENCRYHINGEDFDKQSQWRTRKRYFRDIVMFYDCL